MQIDLDNASMLFQRAGWQPSTLYVFLFITQSQHLFTHLFAEEPAIHEDNTFFGFVFDISELYFTI
jgi:hypothetical protein